MDIFILFIPEKFILVITSFLMSKCLQIITTACIPYVLSSSIGTMPLFFWSPINFSYPPYFPKENRSIF